MGQKKCLSKKCWVENTLRQKNLFQTNFCFKKISGSEKFVGTKKIGVTKFLGQFLGLGLRLNIQCLFMECSSISAAYWTFPRLHHQASEDELVKQYEHLYFCITIFFEKPVK